MRACDVCERRSNLVEIRVAVRSDGLREPGLLDLCPEHAKLATAETLLGAIKGKDGAGSAEKALSELRGFLADLRNDMADYSPSEAGNAWFRRWRVKLDSCIRFAESANPAPATSTTPRPGPEAG